MNDLDNIPGPSSKIPEDLAQPSTSSNYLIPSTYHEEGEHLPEKSEKELQLDLLKRIRKVKMRDDESSSAQFHHIGFKCDYCGEEPVIGTRWHCNTCTKDSIDFCTDCVLTQMYSENCHPLNHNLVSYCDKGSDYLSDSESNTGSGIGSSNVNNGSSECSDSEFNPEDANEDDEMSDVSDKIKDQIISNGILDETSKSDDKMKIEENFNNLPKLDFGNFNDTDDLYGAGLGSDLFSEIENISYDYLHSNLLLDKD
ncbi:ZZ-type zinc finger-containing protein 3 [Asbolus verrucosus]|uniref:ZZ-type zinc finger-containing protein 3 n=1 Tax=Asbolus verrucosus TaxID=1661398 RepID=A0A482VGU1_ASBVE|nr:ZZ-type zinc finger-containing protein 3 [Asbolus verrucosus]